MSIITCCISLSFLFLDFKIPVNILLFLSLVEFEEENICKIVDHVFQLMAGGVSGRSGLNVTPLAAVWVAKRAHVPAQIPTPLMGVEVALGRKKRMQSVTHHRVRVRNHTV